MQMKTNSKSRRRCTFAAFSAKECGMMLRRVREHVFCPGGAVALLVLGMSIHRSLNSHKIAIK